MRLTESMIRRIIRQETKRALNEGDGMYMSQSDADPSAYVKEKMDEIEQMFIGGYDSEDSHYKASKIIDELCVDLKGMLHDWLSTIESNEDEGGDEDEDEDEMAARAEYDFDTDDYREQGGRRKF